MVNKSLFNLLEATIKFRNYQFGIQWLKNQTQFTPSLFFSYISNSLLLSPHSHQLHCSLYNIAQSPTLQPFRVRQILPIFCIVFLPVVKMDHWLYKSRWIDRPMSGSCFSLLLGVHRVEVSATLNIVQIVGVLEQNLFSGGDWSLRTTVDELVGHYKFIRIFVCHPAHHHSPQFMLGYEFLCMFEGFDPSVEGELDIGEILLELVDSIVPQGRHIPVLGRVQPLQEGLPGVNDIMFDVAFSGGFFYEIPGEFIRIEFINAQPALYCAGCPLHSLPHRLHALIHQLRLLHQARSERSLLHFGTGTSYIQIYLIIAILNPDLGSIGEPVRIRAPQLEHDGVLAVMEGQHGSMIINERIVVKHFGVDGGLLGEQAGEVAEVGIRNVLLSG